MRVVRVGLCEECVNLINSVCGVDRKCMCTVLNSVGMCVCVCRGKGTTGRIIKYYPLLY